MRKIVLSILSVFLFSCASETSWRAFKPINITDRNIGIVYIYYFCDVEKKLKYGGDLYINNIKTAYVSQGTYYGLRMNSGLHNIEYRGVDSPHFSLDINLKPGETKYIWIGEPAIVSGDSHESGVIRYMIKEVSTRTGSSEIRSCKWAKKSRLSREDAI